MHVIKHFRTGYHGFYLLLVRPVGDVYEAAVVVFAVTPAGDVLVRPLEVAGAYHCRVGINLFGIGAVCIAPFLFGIHLPESLAKAAVHGTEMVFSDDHGKAGEAECPVEHILAGSQRVRIEAESVEVGPAGLEEVVSEGIRFGEPDAEIEVVAVVFAEDGVDVAEEDPEGLDDEGAPVRIGVSLGGKVLLEFSLYRPVFAVEDYLAEAGFGVDPGGFVAHEVTDQPRIVDIAGGDGLH